MLIVTQCKKNAFILRPFCLSFFIYSNCKPFLSIHAYLMYLRGDKMMCLQRKPLSRRQGGLSRLRGCSEQAGSGVGSRGVVGGHSPHVSGVFSVKGDAGSPSTSAHVFCR